MLYASWQVRLRVTRAGEVLSWLGPALRGTLALRFKHAVCRHPPAERDTRWVHCRGCPLMQGCPYGELFEPDAPPSSVQPLGALGRDTHHRENPAGARRPVRAEAAALASGDDAAARPLVLAPYYPLPPRLEVGQEVPLRVTAVGPAVRHGPRLLEALAEAGPAGLGPQRVTYDLQHAEGDAAQAELHAGHLPPAPDALPGSVPRLGVGLVAPLFLTRYHGRQRRPLAKPQFSDLLRASLRTLTRLFDLYEAPLLADLERLQAASRQVRLVEHCYAPFTQRKWSSRSGDRFHLAGAAGGGVYADVPLAFLPWLLWAGRLHVGMHRVAGAGGWRLVLD